MGLSRRRADPPRNYGGVVGWQCVRYERTGRAHAFLVLEDDTTHTRDRATMWFHWLNKRYGEK
jgi:hypothetical protein